MFGAQPCDCRFIPWRGWIALAAALTVASCGQGAGAGEPEPEVVDHTGSVTDTDFRFGVAGENLDYVGEARGRDSPRLAEAGEGWDLRVAWPGASCYPAPTVEFHGDERTITAITVDTGPHVEPEGDRETCPAVLTTHIVDAQTTAEVAEDIDLS